MTYASFGCSLDVMDAPEKLAMKLAYLNALREGVIQAPLARDPYDLLMNELGETPGIVTVGRLELEPWMTPRPGLDAIGNVDVALAREFLDTGGCNVVASRLREFVRDRVMPLSPFLVGVDHSLTGGVLQALAADGAGSLSLVVLDSHLDAIPASVRRAAALALSETETVAGEGEPEPEPPDSLTCGSWLASVMDSGLVAPEKIAVIGPSDYPGTQAGDEPDAVRNFRDAYAAIEERGVTVIPKRRVREIGAEAAAREAVQAIGAGRVYVSIDADVGAGEAVKAVRFLDTIGLDPDEVPRLCGALARELAPAGAELCGFDVMEIDTHLADIPGSGDRTLEMCARAVRALLRLVGENGDRR